MIGIWKVLINRNVHDLPIVINNETANKYNCSNIQRRELLASMS